MNDPQQRDRQRLIAPPVAFSSGGEARSQSYAPNSIWTLGVIRDVGKYVGTVWTSGTTSDPGSVLRWQRGRYARGQQPTFGEYEAYGPIETGYPVETKKGSDFVALKVPTSDIPGSAVFVRATWRGGFWIIETMAGGGGIVTQFRVRECVLYHDSIIAEVWDDSETLGVRFHIAKPWLVRREPFDFQLNHRVLVNGKKYVYQSNTERTASTTSPAASEKQVIVPPYWAGQTIYAVKGVEGGTGVTYLDNFGVSTKVEWLEVSTARAFTRKNVQT